MILMEILENSNERLHFPGFKKFSKSKYLWLIDFINFIQKFLLVILDPDKISFNNSLNTIILKYRMAIE